LRDCKTFYNVFGFHFKHLTRTSSSGGGESTTAGEELFQKQRCQMPLTGKRQIQHAKMPKKRQMPFKKRQNKITPAHGTWGSFSHISVSRDTRQVPKRSILDALSYETKLEKIDREKVHI
jgi:hypothetical protein